MAAARTQDDIVAQIRAYAPRIRALGVKRLGLFGSFRRAVARPDSDVDLLVEFAPGAKSFDRFTELSFLLEDVLGRTVDLVTVEALSPHIGPHILKEVDYVTLAA